MKNTDLYKKIIFAITVIGNFTAVFESNTVNVALYEIANTFDIALNEVQLVTSGYILIFTLFLPLFGKLSDIVDRGKLSATGFLLFGLGALFNTFAGSFPALLISRCIEATGASILISNSSAVITLIYKGETRGKALGTVGAVVALAGISAPAVAGAIIQYFGWHSVFIPSVVFSIIGIYGSLKYIPNLKSEEAKNIDFKGFILFSVALFSCFSLIVSYGTFELTRTLTPVLITITILFSFLFYKREKSISYPIINLDLFKNKTFSLGCLGLLMSFCTLFANSIIFPFFTQDILKFSPLKTGLLILPFSIMMMGTAPLSGAYAGKHGSKNITAAGCIILFTGLAILFCADTNTGIFTLIIAQAIMGIGNGMFQSPSNTALMSSVERKYVGTASGLLSLSRNTGFIIGTVTAVGLFDATRRLCTLNDYSYNNSFIIAFKTIIAVCMITSLLCSITSYLAYKDEKTTDSDNV